MSDEMVQSPVDGYGFKRSDDFDFPKYNAFMTAYLPVMTRRASRWNQVLGNKVKITKSGTVKRFCRKGIPSAERPKAWMCLSGAEDRMMNNPHLYQQMLGADHNKELIETINMDIHRTFPENMYFASSNDSRCLRKPLYNILVAIGHRNRTLGYCQGMGFVVGLMLLIMKNEDNYEEKVFWLMDTLINNILPEYYHPDMHAVKLDLEVLGELVRWKAPDIYNHLEQQGMSWCLIGMKWLICLYADVLPVDVPLVVKGVLIEKLLTEKVTVQIMITLHIEVLVDHDLHWLLRQKCLPLRRTVLRIWDCMFNEGPKILMRVALVIILNNKDKILRCTNFGEITDLFKETVVGKDSLHCHLFLLSMFKDVGSLPMARIQTLRQQCESKVS